MKKFSMMLVAVITMFVSLNVPVLASESNTLYDTISKQAVRDDIRSEYVNSDTGIDIKREWKNYNGVDYEHPIYNGLGVYTVADTLKDKYPIRYYRGEVNNNNVLFGGYCWQIVRTTETGGVKLVYNGKINDRGTCLNPQDDEALKPANAFSNNYSLDNGYTGYMYGIDTYYVKTATKNLSWYNLANLEFEYPSSFDLKNYYFSDAVTYQDGKYQLVNATKPTTDNDDFFGKYTCLSTNQTCQEVFYSGFHFSSSFVKFTNGQTYDTIIEELKQEKTIFGEDVEYKNGKYQLKGTKPYSLMETIDDKKHYTCFTNNDECEKVYYIGYYYVDNEYKSLQYFIFENGMTVDSIVNELKNSTNAHDSEMKKVLDRWYEKNLTSYQDYLEDTVWCSDRTVSDWGGLDKSASLRGDDFHMRTYRGLNPYDFGFTPTLSCPSVTDSFTVSTKNGNGKLTYPIGTLTIDEASYAGNGSIFLGYEWDIAYISMTMDDLSSSSEYTLPYQNQYALVESSITPYGGGGCGTCRYVRPAISLKHNVAVKSGDGTPDNPFTVEEIPEEIPNTSDGFMDNTLIFGLSLMMLLMGFYMNRKVRYEE